MARFTAFSISSIDMSIEIALRRARKPNVPIANSAPESRKVCVAATGPKWMSNASTVILPNTCWKPDLFATRIPMTRLPAVTAPPMNECSRSRTPASSIMSKATSL